MEVIATRKIVLPSIMLKAEPLFAVVQIQHLGVADLYKVHGGIKLHVSADQPFCQLIYSHKQKRQNQRRILPVFIQKCFHYALSPN